MVSTVGPTGRACGALELWMARLVRDIALWLRAPGGFRPDWSER